MHIASLADLLHETAEQHDLYDKVAPKHSWWDWYAAYISARQQDRSPEAASNEAGRYVAWLKREPAA